MTLLLALLFAISPIEQSYGPYPRPERGGRHALAAGGGGALLAWSEKVDGSRIHVGLLDSRARLVSPISILPLANQGADAYAPAVSFNGGSFLVVWIERYRGGERIRGALVDGNGNPIGTPQTYGSTQVTSNDLVTPSIVWDGAGWHVWGVSRVFTILPSGEQIPDDNPWPMAQAFAMENGVLATASSKMTPVWTGCFLFRCRRVGDAWDIVWTAGGASGTKSIGSPWPVGTTPLSAPNIAPTGDEFAVAWTSSLGVGYLLTHPSLNSENVYATPSLSVAPGLACGDDRCVIAYGTLNGDVHALAFELDSVGSPESFTVATTERTEHQPLVHHLGSGRFLVSYLSDQSTDLRINGRIVAFGPTRQRSIR